MSALTLVRRALTLPPAEAARKARRLARMRLSELNLRVADLVARDPLAQAGAGRPAAFPGADAVLPLAWPAAMPVASPELVERVRLAARRALEHRFDLLGSGPVRVDYALVAPGLEGHRYRMAPGDEAAAAQRARMERLLPGSAPAGYEPVDWHVDFRSGWRWPPSTWYQRIRPGRPAGADVKVPWELSRLQHVGALGLAWRLAPTSPEGAAAPLELTAQVVDWLAANPLHRGINWACTMDVALRALSWLAGLALFEGAPSLTPDFRGLLFRALRLHGLHIESNLEYDPDRAINHYLANVLGLLALGAALPEAPEADRWLAFGLQELAAESARELLPDGVQLEGSTAYHAFVLEMFLVGAAIAARLPEARRERLRAAWPAGAGDSLRGQAPGLAPLARQALELRSPGILPAEVHERLLAAARLTAELQDDDGLLPQVGDHDSGRVFKLVPAGDVDTAGDVAGRAGDLVEEPRDWRQALALAGALYGDAALAAAGAPYALNGALIAPRAVPVSGGRASAAVRAGRRDDPAGDLALFPHGGLAVARAGRLRLLASFGTLAGEATGNHQHNDLLAFELSWGGERLVVDGGTYVYTPLPELRDAFRRTAAHSTIAVAGREQRRWPAAAVSLFLVTRDAELERLAAVPGRLELECRYPGVRHRREWRWSGTRLAIQDTVEADAPASLVLNLAPAVRVEGGPEPAGDGVACVLRAGKVRARLRIGGVTGAEVRPGVYSVGYGRRVPNPCIVAPLAGGRCETVFELEEVKA